MKPYFFTPIGILLLLAGLNLSCKQPTKEKEPQKPNILFIAVDDLRLQAGIYGQEQMKTPNLDKLGSEGTVFTRAYCSVPVCGASRASLLSGMRPTSNRFTHYATRKDKDFPDYPSLPKHFKNHGYTSICNGKIYHHVEDDSIAWSETPYLPQTGIGWQNYISDASKEIIEQNKIAENKAALVKGPAWECVDVEDNAYPDGLIAEKSIKDLQRFSKSKEPFFLAVGFWKPHLPFNAPKKYWDLYNDEEIKLATNPYKPVDAPGEAMHYWAELRMMYDKIPRNGTVSDSLAKKLVHGYYACVSYTDTQIGKILNELERLGMAENTVVVLWGDHGWHLGEHTLWCKHSNFHRVTNSPLIVRTPGMKQGIKTEAITEFIDIYPSLCELANLPVPQHLDGTSFIPVLNDPNEHVKEAAFVKYQGAESIITQTHNYTEFLDKQGNVKATMLYNIEEDPDENKNISLKKGNQKLVDELSRRLSRIKQSKIPNANP
ncbi:sulfatase [Seonamhaeicola marinus]|uniref:Sulfatase n=1 Tax=Seonamhaeicola marinus TaxID=1912246 RepID=A0A5D0IZD7_9FLAO|nr:sulfatase [Seonamhaeicola marinus]TYA89263.1 sulfatase [Seonamhaeicola marinus]